MNTGSEAAASFYLGNVDESRCLNTADLQGDGGPQLRAPTAVACLPGLLVVGFDTGHVQSYKGYPEATQPGPCFCLSAGRPVTFVKVMEGWDPFTVSSSPDRSVSDQYHGKYVSLFFLQSGKQASLPAILQACF